MTIKIRDISSPEYIAHQQWMRTLQVGDSVCDCRLQHLKITAIENHYTVKFPFFLRRIIFAEWVPYWIGNVFYDIFCWVSRKIGNVELIDKSLVLEDGAHCSAMSCCDNIAHTWEH